jgi:hypothetical protein
MNTEQGIFTQNLFRSFEINPIKQKHRGSRTHATDTRTNQTEPPQNQPHPPTHAPDHTRTPGPRSLARVGRRQLQLATNQTTHPIKRGLVVTEMATAPRRGREPDGIGDGTRRGSKRLRRPLITLTVILPVL